MESFFRLVNALIPPPLSSALVSPTHIAKGWKFCTLQPFCRWTWIFIHCLHLPSLPPPLCALPLSPLCLSNFPFSDISLSSSLPLLSRPLICQGLYLCLPNILYRTSRYDIRPSVNTQIFSSFVSGWERVLLNVLVKVEACLSLSTCKF